MAMTHYSTVGQLQLLTFKKKCVVPVHVHLKMDKLDYLQSPMTDLQKIILYILALDKLLETLTGGIGICPVILLLVLLNSWCDLRHTSMHVSIHICKWVLQIKVLKLISNTFGNPTFQK